MIRAFSLIPRHVLLSLATIIAAALVFGMSYLIIGGGLETAVSENTRLLAEIQQSESGIMRAREDHDYVQQNLEKYEALLKSDRLIPHTRRAAVVELQRLAQQRGLSKLNYTFDYAPPDSAVAVASQANSAYRLSVENVELAVGAPFDGPIYGFISDITEQFPGAAVVGSVSLARAGQVTDEELAQLGAAGGSRLVEGEILLLWRTAQVQEGDGSTKR